MTGDETERFDSADREARDALLTAYALGELQGADLAFVERLLADPAAEDDRRGIAEIRAVAAALRVARGHDAPPRSSDLRHAVVAALARAPAPAAPVPAPPGTRVRRVAWIALAGATAAAVLVAVTQIAPRPDRREVARLDAGETPTEEATRPRAVAQARPAEERSAAKRSVETVPAAAAPAAPEVRESRVAESGARQWAAAAREQNALAASVQPAAPGAPAERSSDAPATNAELTTGLAPGGGGAGFGGRARVESVTDMLAADAADFDGQGVEAARTDQEDVMDRERFGRFDENRFLTAADRPLSTFSIDVDTASYAVVRRFLAAGRLPPADAVRIEEFVNYFPYAYPQPTGDEPFAVALEATDCPWHAGHRLVRIGIAGRDIDPAQRPSGNLVFLVDVSGSMDEPDKLPLVKQALAMLVDELTENDRVSIVTYAGDAGLKLPPTSGDQKERILAVIAGLSAGGATHGSAGIELAYEQAQERFIPGGANRVILCTDGDLNVGVTSDAALVELVQEKARGGTFLTVLGFGRGNLQDEKLEAIADQGNGIYAYVDGVREARKVLVEQLAGSTIAIAKDVKIQVEFNPALVASYRLVGYENRRLADADFRDDTQDAGEIGAGHTVTALYELVPAGGGQADTDLLTVKLRFKQPEGDTSVFREFPLTDAGGTFENASADTRFAAAVAAFGMILRNSEFRGDATLDRVGTIALDALGTDEGGHRAEFLDLVRKAEAFQGGDRR